MTVTQVKQFYNIRSRNVGVPGEEKCRSQHDDLKCTDVKPTTRQTAAFFFVASSFRPQFFDFSDGRCSLEHPVTADTEICHVSKTRTKCRLITKHSRTDYG